LNAGDWIREALERLTAAGVEEPKLDAQLLAARVLGQDRSWVLAHPEAEIPRGAEDLLERRVAREPLAYILGHREFFGRVFAVEPGVLVPRQETETLVEVALEGLGGKVLDVGTGSGCLAVTIKLERPQWMVAACDVSQVALRVARYNAETLGATVHVTRSDLFEAFAGIQFGLIVSNPPYIPEGEQLQPEVGLFEPGEALFAGADGLAVYRRLAGEAAPFLTPWGHLVVELGDGMSSSVTALFEERAWTLVEIRNDLGGVPRAAVFRR
jgi:release factor glutamine methyltransferase